MQSEPPTDPSFEEEFRLWPKTRGGRITQSVLLFLHFFVGLEAGFYQRLYRTTLALLFYTALRYAFMRWAVGLPRLKQQVWWRNAGTAAVAAMLSVMVISNLWASKVANEKPVGLMADSGHFTREVYQNLQQSGKFHEESANTIRRNLESEGFLFEAPTTQDGITTWSGRGPGKRVGILLGMEGDRLKAVGISGAIAMMNGGEEQGGLMVQESFITLLMTIGGYMGQEDMNALFQWHQEGLSNDQLLQQHEVLRRTRFFGGLKCDSFYQYLSHDGADAIEQELTIRRF